MILNSAYGKSTYGPTGVPRFRTPGEDTVSVGMGLVQALGMAAGIINAFGLVAVFGGLIGACISGLSERPSGA